jgi:hypothetical protein
LESSEPVSMIRRQSGMISVERRKLITSELSFCYNVNVSKSEIRPDQTRKDHKGSLTLTRAPMTPSEVRRRYSNGRVLLVVLRKG